MIVIAFTPFSITTSFLTCLLTGLHIQVSKGYEKGGAKLTDRIKMMTLFLRGECQSLRNKKGVYYRGMEKAYQEVIAILENIQKQQAG